MKLNTKRINFKLWIYFTAFSGIILVVLWLLQIVFLSSFYKSMKKNEIITIGKEIKESYYQDNFEDKINELAFRNSILIFMIDNDGNVMNFFDEHVLITREAPMRGNDTISGNDIIQGNIGGYRTLSTQFDNILKQLKQTKEQYTIDAVHQDRFNGETLVYGTKLPEGYLIISTPIEAMNGATVVLRTQLVYVTIISLTFSFLVAYFISKKFTKPISQITDSAKELAKGNYDVKFEDGHYAEIDELIETLNYTAKELSKVENLRRELIANVSHDLRTPLTLIKAYSEMVYDKTGNMKEKREEQLQIIISETDRLTNLVNNILDLSKLQSGNEEIKLDNVNLSEIVERVLDGFNLLCDKEGYVINKNIWDNLYVLGDAVRLEQVLYNLIGNAINHIGENKTIHVNLKDLGEIIRFEVTDNGDGIAKEDILHIWERYYKAKNHKEKHDGGLGIGLSIVKNILELHKAKYGVESVVGKETTFWFEIKK